MAIERFANAAQTTLAAAITGVGDTTLTVVSAALFPTAGNFRLLIDSELLIVTGVAGTTFTITRGAEGTTPAVHAVGATVTLIATAQSLVGGPLSTLIGTGFRSVPAVADFAWINQGTATATDTPRGIVLYAPAVSLNNMRILKKTAPSTPYTITAVLNPMVTTSASYNAAGLVFRQSSDGKLHYWGYRYDGNFSTQKYSSPTAYAATYTMSPTNSPLQVPRPMILRIADDGASRICSYSPDGVTFFTYHSVGRTDYLTADEVGVFVESNNATYAVAMTVLSWEEA